MPKFPINVNGDSVEIQEFIDGDQRIILIDERSFRVRPTEDERHYFMLKLGGAQRSIKGTIEEVRETIVRVHLTYREYDKRCRRLKEDAQRARDRALLDIAGKLES